MAIPKDITIDSENGNQVASFNFNEGKEVAREKGLVQTSSYSQVYNGTGFIISCGDVMMKVSETDYPEIQRRTI